MSSGDGSWKDQDTADWTQRMRPVMSEVQADESDESLLDTANLVAQTAVLASNYDLEDPEILVSAAGLIGVEDDRNLSPQKRQVT